jgi:phosphopantothenoylcysteine decarboxylase/phosphopantothenate--cysteine ligase
MGFALAEAACDEGAFVSLISGPVNLPTPERIFRHDVETAKQMYDKVNEMIDEIDIFIATAAVCDIKPSHPSNQKIKKQQILDANNILLEENPDIVASVKKAHPNKKVIGFAAETENVLDNAKLKLSEKELDLIIANDVSNAEIGFDSDDNEVHLISEKNSRKINKSTKEKVSREIIKYISDNLK